MRLKLNRHQILKKYYYILLTIDFIPKHKLFFKGLSIHLLCDRAAESLQILLFRNEGKTLHQPVIKSVMAKLKTNVLYGVFSIDLFCKITTSKRQLQMMASDPMTPNIMLRPVVILTLNSLQSLPSVVKSGFPNGWHCLHLFRQVHLLLLLFMLYSQLFAVWPIRYCSIFREWIVFIYTSKTSAG